jgi:hypothetical protein
MTRRSHRGGTAPIRGSAAAIPCKCPRRTNALGRPQMLLGKARPLCYTRAAPGTVPR